MAAPTLVHWNCRGFHANIDEVQQLLAQHNVSVLCLQETKLSDPFAFSMRGYSGTFKHGPCVDRPAGGVGVIVRDDIPHTPVTLSTPLQACAVQVTVGKMVTVCSLYLPGRQALNPKELDELFRQLPSPALIVGDFNSHNPLWGSSICNVRGKQIEDFINRHDLCILNSDSPTYLVSRSVLRRPLHLC